MHDDLHGRRPCRRHGAALCPHPLLRSPPVNVATCMCRASLPWRRHPWCVTHLGRGARARERVTQAVDSWSGVLGRDSNTPRTGDACCRRATIARPARPQSSPTGNACAPLACSKEIVMRGRYGTRPTRRCQHHFPLPPEPSTMIPRGGTPDGSCKTQGEATRNARACTSAAITNSGRKRGRHNGRCRRLWTVRVASRRCYGHRGPEHGTTASVFLT
jgi:hypothetical protein